MYQSLVTLRYAKAFFLKAEEDGFVDQANKDIQLIQKSLLENPDIYKTIQHPVIPISKKQKIIQKIFESHVHDTTLKFLMLILENKREKFFKDICRNFIDIYNENKGIKTVELTTTVKLAEKEKTAIKNLIKEAFNATKVTFTEKIDKSLIGGFLIKIEDQLIDASVKRQLDKIKYELVHKKWN
jgi:F-type H+-transporting ATPase subunit delta